MATELISPRELSAAEVGFCVSLISDGGAVERKYVERYFPESASVALIRIERLIVGVGVIKPRREEYANQVAKRSGYRLAPELHELGYVTLHRDYQGKGLSHEIVGALVSAFADQPIFATTSSGAMKTALSRVGFEPRGVEWKGSKGDLLSLWLRVPPGS